MHKDTEPFAEFEAQDINNDDNRRFGVEVTLLFKSGTEDTFFIECRMEDFLHLWARRKSQLLLYDSSNNEFSFVDKRQVAMMKCRPFS